MKVGGAPQRVGSVVDLRETLWGEAVLGDFEKVAGFAVWRVVICVEVAAAGGGVRNAVAPGGSFAGQEARMAVDDALVDADVDGGVDADESGFVRPVRLALVPFEPPVHLVPGPHPPERPMLPLRKLSVQLRPFQRFLRSSYVAYC